MDISITSNNDRRGQPSSGTEAESFSASVADTLSGADTATGSLVASAGNGNPPILPFARTVDDMAIRDLDGNRLYGAGDFPSNYTTPTSGEASAAVADRIVADPNVRFAIIGEVHTDSADRRFFDIAQRVSESGRPMIAIIETPTTPALDALIDRYQAGELSREDFLEQGSAELHDHYMNAYNNHGVPAGEERPAPLDQEFWRARLETDVVRYHEAGIQTELVDAGRFVPGANRDEVMADRMQEIADANPDSVLVAQLGVLHGQESSSYDMVPGFDVNSGAPDNSWSYRGAVMSKSDEQLPTAERLAVSNGGNAVLTFALDEMHQYQGYDYGYMWYPISETEDRPVGEQMSTNSFDYIIPSWDPLEVDNPNVEPEPVIQDAIPPATS